MIIARLMLAFLVSGVYQTKIQMEYLDFGPLYSHVAAGFLSAALSMLVFFCSKWTLYIRSKTQGTSIFWRTSEVFISPLILVYMFTFPLAGFSMVGLDFLGVALLCVLVVGDFDGTLSRFLWERRSYGFEKYPDSGLVSIRELYNKEFVIVLLYFGVPLGGLMISPLYGTG